MKNFIEKGEVAIVPAPADTLSGDFIVVGALYGVAQYDALSGVSVAIVREGVFDLPKASGAWTAGDQLYWDSNAKNFTKTVGANKPVGIAFADAASGDTTGSVAIDEVPTGVTDPVTGVGAYKIARGVASITGSGTVVTGLATVVAIIATLQDDAALTGNSVTASIGDQNGAPAAGSVNLKVWKPTASGDCTPIAATAAKSVNWVAVGT